MRLGVAENTVMDALAIAFSGNKDNRKIWSMHTTFQVIWEKLQKRLPLKDWKV